MVLKNINDNEEDKFKETPVGSGIPAVRTCDVNLDPDTSDYATTNSDGDDCIRTCGESVPQGLANEGRITIVSVTDSAWTRVTLTPTPLSGRRGASIQNTDGLGVDNSSSILVNYALAVSPATPPTGAKGIVIRSGEERQYDVNDSVDFWIRVVASGGTQDIVYEEIA